MQRHEIVAVGTSAGGVEALIRLVAGLPPGFPAALFVVCHIPAGAYSRLPEILSAHGALLARRAQDGEPIHYGHVYVAPPDYHLLLEPGVVRLTRGPRENHNRPAIDPLFRSAARAYGERVIGVVLTGSLSDGAAGLLAIRNAGGTAIIQDPAEALVAAMPQAARIIAGADHVLPLAQIPELLVQLVQEPIALEGVPAVADRDPLEELPERVDHDMAAQQEGARRGQVSCFTCPECGGVLWQVDEAEPLRFRCHTGHAFYGVSLLSEQSEALEAALWTAVRIFKEKMVLARQMAAQERARDNSEAASRFEDDANLSEHYSELIEQHILRASQPPGNGG
jgi:two-component system chemotaxis response regulator CheB